MYRTVFILVLFIFTSLLVVDRLRCLLDLGLQLLDLPLASACLAATAGLMTPSVPPQHPQFSPHPQLQASTSWPALTRSRYPQEEK